MGKIDSEFEQIASRTAFSNGLWSRTEFGLYSKIFIATIIIKTTTKRSQKKSHREKREEREEREKREERERERERERRVTYQSI